MEEASNSLCALCYVSLPSSLLAEGIRREEANAAIINKFCRQLNANGSSSTELNSAISFPVCPECLVSMGTASATREKAEDIEGQVRSLQREILQLLRHLQQCMGGYLSEMRAIEYKIKSSGNGIKGRGGEEKLFGASETLKWRNEIIAVVKDLSLFQNQLSSKVISADEHSNGIQAMAQIKTEAEVADDDNDCFTAAPEFYDLHEQQSDEEEVDKKHDILSINDHVASLTRRTRRSAAATATIRSASARRQVVKKIKAENVKRSASAVPSKTASKCGRATFPNWVVGKRVHARSSSRRSYRCELCPEFTSRYPYHLEHHLRQHEVELQNSPKPFTCPQCSSSFALKQLYEYHVACHGRLLTSACDICNLKLPLLDMEAHFKDAHAGTTKIFRCDNCLFCCSTRDTYLGHLQFNHFGDKIAMTCDLCLERFYSRKEHLKHLHEQHGVIEKLECGLDGCTRTFLDIWLLKTHHVLHKRPFTCLECDYKCVSARQLEIHQSKHSTDRPFQCARCALTFKTENGWKNHEAAHDRVPTTSTDTVPEFQCHLCEKSFKHKRSLQEHLRMHEGLGYKCDQCGAVCVNKSGFKRHLQSHDEKRRKFFCEHCGKGFGSGQHLRKHVMTIHENAEKKYKCSICPKAFHVNINLKQHLRVHTGEKPFVCDTCGKAFSQAVSLRQHRKLVHGLQGNSAVAEEHQQSS